jgi:hypothetical protein
VGTSGITVGNASNGRQRLGELARHLPAAITHESHASEQAGSALGGPPEGEDARGEAAITVGTVQGARTQASRTLSGSAGDDGGTETSFRAAGARSYVIRTSSRPRCK